MTPTFPQNLKKCLVLDLTNLFHNFEDSIIGKYVFRQQTSDLLCILNNKLSKNFAIFLFEIYVQSQLIIIAAIIQPKIFNGFLVPRELRLNSTLLSVCIRKGLLRQKIIIASHCLFPNLWSKYREKDSFFDHSSGNTLKYTMNSIVNWHNVFILKN